MTRAGLTLVFVWIMLAAGPVAAQEWHRPDAPQAGRAMLLLAGEMNAGSGVGLGVDYDVPVAEEAGPGRLLVGSLGVGMAAQQQTRFGGCNVQHSESLFGVVGYARYVVDLHPQLRPWMRAGLGLQVERFQRDTLAGCAFDYDERFFFSAPAGVVGFGMDVDLTELAFFTVALDGHTGSDDFATLGLGAGLRF